MELLKVALTAILSAVALFILAKLTGRKQVAQLDFFDYVNGITIGSIAAEMATELETPLKPLVAMVVYSAVALTLTLVSHKFPRLRKYLNGSPTVIIQNGKLSRTSLKKSKLDLSEFMVMCREAGYFSITDIEHAVFEFNGRLSILPKSDKRPLTPSDMSQSPKRASPDVEVIMDGHVMGANLRKLGYDESWLDRRLHAQGYGSPRDVFLAVVDGEGNLAVFAGD